MSAGVSIKDGHVKVKGKEALTRITYQGPAELKQIMTSVAMLESIKVGNPFIPNANVSDITIGGVLSQAEWKRETNIVCQQSSEFSSVTLLHHQKGFVCSGSAHGALQVLFSGMTVFDLERPCKLGVADVVQAGWHVIVRLW